MVILGEVEGSLIEEVRVIGGSGHQIPFEGPEQTVDLIVDTVGRWGGAGGWGKGEEGVGVGVEGGGGGGGEKV
jgi:hypothetical protein